MKKKILVVEDNGNVNEMLSRLLGREYQVMSVFSEMEALSILQRATCDLIVLDRVLPRVTSKTVLEEFRKLSTAPIILVTASCPPAEMTELLAKGANDYITKPFDIAELKARIAVQLHHGLICQPVEYDGCLQYKRLILHPQTCVVSTAEQALSLRRKDFEILLLLIKHPHKIYTKESLYEQIWQAPYEGAENTINVHLSNLRKKLKSLDPKQEYIETIWGVGIKLA